MRDMEFEKFLENRAINVHSLIQRLTDIEEFADWTFSIPALTTEETTHWWKSLGYELPPYLTLYVYKGGFCMGDDKFNFARLSDCRSDSRKVFRTVGHIPETVDKLVDELKRLIKLSYNTLGETEESIKTKLSKKRHV